MYDEEDVDKPGQIRLQSLLSHDNNLLKGGAMLKEVKKVNLADMVVDQIKELIISKELGAGMQLKSVRDLASELKVNPMTISKVYTYLELEGFVERKRGIGLFVKQHSDDEMVSKIELLKKPLKDAAQFSCRLNITKEKAVSLFSDILDEIDKEEKDD